MPSPKLFVVAGSPESIPYNFEYGYQNLYKYFDQFDSLTLFDNSISDGERLVVPKEIVYILKGSLLINHHPYPNWIKPIVDFFNQQS